MKVQTSQEILHNLPYEAISVTVDATTEGTEIVNGRKLLKAGTVLYGDGGSIFEDRTRKVKKAAANTAADGILLYDVDLTDGDAAVALVYRGTVRSDRVVGYTSELDSALPQIKFVAGV